MPTRLTILPLTAGNAEVHTITDLKIPASPHGLSLEDNEPEDIVSTDMDLDEEWVLSDSEEEQDDAFIGVNKSYNDQIDDEMLKPIYEKANITLCAAYSILEFKQSCHLSFTAIKKTA